LKEVSEKDEVANSSCIGLARQREREKKKKGGRKREAAGNLKLRLSRFVV